MRYEFLEQLTKGIIIAVLYFEITQTNDTNFQNIFLFVSFYVSMIYGAKITNIDPNVVTSAFLSKTVFTLVDERIRKNDKQENKQ